MASYTSVDRADLSLAQTWGDIHVMPCYAMSYIQTILMILDWLYPWTGLKLYNMRSRYTLNQ